MKLSSIKLFGNIRDNGLTEDENNELYALEYVLTWGYSEDSKRDTVRYLQLVLKKERYLNNK